MKCLKKQSQNSGHLLSALALLSAFCLVGWPLESRAQSAGTPLSDVTLEQFMSALEARYSNFNVYSVDGNNMVVNPGGNPVYFFTYPTDFDGYIDLLAIAKLLGVNGLSSPQVGEGWLAEITEMLNSGNYSNAAERVSALIGERYGYEVTLTTILDYFYNTALYQSGWGNQTWTDLQYTLMPALSAIASATVSPVQQGQSQVYPSEDAAITTVDADLFRRWIYDVGGVSHPDYYLPVHDWRVADAVSNAASSITESIGNIFDDDGTLVTELSPDSVRDITNALARLELNGATNRVSDALSQALAGVTNGTTAIELQDSASLTNALTSVTNAIEGVALDVTNAFSDIQSELSSVVATMLGNEQGSTVLYLTPTMNVGLDGIVSIPLSEISVDLNDSRFTVGGWPLWRVLRAACLLAWWAWWVIWFVHFIRSWSQKFAGLIGS